MFPGNSPSQSPTMLLGPIPDNLVKILFVSFHCFCFFWNLLDWLLNQLLDFHISGLCYFIVSNHVILVFVGKNTPTPLNVVTIAGFMNMIQMKLEKKRSSSMDKIMNKLKSAQKRAQEMRSSMLASRAHQVARTSHKAVSFRRTRQASLSGCFTCHAF